MKGFELRIGIEQLGTCSLNNSICGLWEIFALVLVCEASVTVVLPEVLNPLRVELEGK